MNDTIIILGGSADIGQHLLQKFIENQNKVIATCRKEEEKKKLLDLGAEKVFICDYSDYSSIENFVKEFALSGYSWNSIISSIGTMLPIGKFLEINYL